MAWMMCIREAKDASLRGPENWTITRMVEKKKMTRAKTPSLPIATYSAGIIGNRTSCKRMLS